MVGRGQNKIKAGHVEHAKLRGSGGMPPQEIFENQHSEIEFQPSFSSKNMLETFQHAFLCNLLLCQSQTLQKLILEALATMVDLKCC